MLQCGERHGCAHGMRAERNGVAATGRVERIQWARRRAIALVALAALWLVAAAAWPAHAGKSRSGGVFEGVPDDVQMALHIDHIDDVVHWLTAGQDVIEGSEDFAEAVADPLGVDRIDLDALREAGVDPHGGVTIAILGDVGEAEMVSYAASKRAWKRVASAEGFARAKERKVAGCRLRVRGDGRAAAWFDGRRLTLLAADVDLVLVDVEAIARHAIEAGRTSPLARRDVVRRVVGASRRSGAVLYADRNARLWIEDQTPAAFSGPGGTMAARIAWDDTTLSYEGWMEVEPSEADAAAWRPTTDPMPFVRRLSAEPRLLVLGRMNGAAVVKRVYDALPDSAFSDSTAAASLETMREILRLVDGNVGLMVESASMVAPSITAFVQTHDPDAAHAMLERLARQTRRSLAKNKGDASAVTVVEDRAGARTAWRYRVPPMYEVCVGVAGDHAVLTTAWARLRALAEGAGDSSGGLRLGAPMAQAALDDPASGVVYVNVHDLVRDAAPMAAALGPDGARLTGVLARVRDITAVARFEGDGQALRGRIRVADARVWRDLLKLAVEADE